MPMAFDLSISKHQCVNPSGEAISIPSGKYKRFTFVHAVTVTRQRLRLHGAIYRPDSFVLLLRYCTNLKAIRNESTSLNRIVAYRSHRVIVAKHTPAS